MVDTKDIMKILPHRPPMLLIDAVLEYEVADYAVAQKVFSYNEMYFQGHYPQRPIVPGTLLLEGLSQTAAFAILSDVCVGGGEEKLLLFTGVSRLRFLKTVVPGDSVIYKAAIVENRHGLWSVNGEGMVNGQTCIKADMTFIKK